VSLGGSEERPTKVGTSSHHRKAPVTHPAPSSPDLFASPTPASPDLLTPASPHLGASPTPSTLSPAYPDRAAWGTATSLRAWQQEALGRYFAEPRKDFLAVATPGAGKTTFALTLASELIRRRLIDRLTIVAPTEHLKVQWAEAASRAGLAIDPAYSPTKGRTSTDYVGVAITYAGVAANPLAFRVRTERYRTLVILDEVHHAGDALSWGEAVREAFEPATRRLALTGTPFRSDINAIPFVTYAPDDEGIPRSVADYSYGYAEALAQHVVRPVLFMAYSGQVQWRSRAGDEVAARLGEPLTKDQTAQALRTALDVDGAWVPAVLEAADRRLSEVRRHVPDAGGLVIASDQASARAYGALLARISGERPTVVLSDEKASSRKISAFAASEKRWMVAVRMVSEGVDVPRLSVGVYATTTSTALFFSQAVGRLVRARRRGETATVFLPSVLTLLSHAAAIEVQRDHVLGRPVRDEDDIFSAEQDLLDRALEEADSPGDEGPGFAALSSEASFDRVLYDGGEFGHEGEVAVGSDEEMDFLGIPGLLEADQVRELLKHRQSERMKEQRRTARRPAEPAAHERLAALRKELNGLVAAWHHRSGSPHGVIHAELRRHCGGPPAAVATADELTARIATIRDWASRRTS
jgi:superfamily II DNA or RNA helicase